MSRNRNNEEGLAMITALLVTMVATALLVASIALATHSSGQSAQQRNATAALHAADFGLQQELATLSASSTGGVPALPSCTSSSGLLPGTSLPAQWFSVTVLGWTQSPAATPACNPADLTRTIISTGYAVGAGVGTTPPATPPTGAVARTVVAHITLQPSGATSNGGYGFPDAITALKGSGSGQSGAINTTSSGFPLTVSGLSGNPVSIRADGPVKLTGGTLTLGSNTISNSLQSWDDVTLSGTKIIGNVTSADQLKLTNSTSITGNALGTSVSTSGGSTVSGVTRVQTPTLPTQPPVPSFPSPADPGWNNWLALTGGSVQSGCPGATLTGLYVLTGSASCMITSAALTPVAGSTAVAVIVTGTAGLTVTVPTSVPSGAQLYLVVANGDLNLIGSGSALPVFAYGSGTVTVNGSGGAIAGQLIGGNITTSGATSLVAESVSTTVGATPTFPPDFAFPNFAGTGAPPPGYVPQITDEYLCAPFATTSC